MEYFIIAITVLFGSGLTFFSGFGLGTLMLPVFSLFFPIPIAIGATALVHFSNNIFKFFLVRKDVDMHVLLKFGIPAICAAFFGSVLLEMVDTWGRTINYSVFKNHFETDSLKISIGILMMLFALFELIPRLKNITIDKKWLPAGGILSGFFGGYSGHQGAFRATFLTKSGLSKEAFIATSNSVSLLVDGMRMSVYFFGAFLISTPNNSIFKVLENNKSLLLVAIICAFVGTYFGKKLVKKTTIKSIQLMVGVLLLVLAVLIGMGII